MLSTVFTRITLLCLFLGAISAGLHAQDCDSFVPDLTINGVLEGPPGSTICVEFETNGWNFPNGQGMQGFDISLTWDPEILQFDSFNDELMLDGPMLFAQNRIDEGLLPISYVGLSGNCLPYPDGTFIFEICFVVIGEIGQETCLNIVKPEPSSSVLNFVGCDCVYEPEPHKIGNVIVSCDALESYTTSCSSDIGLGTIQVDPCGGNAPYDVALCIGASNIANMVVNNQDGVATFTSLAPGNYTVKIEDDNGDTFSENITIEDNPPLTVSFEKRQPTCFNGKNGRISAIPSGGNAVTADDYSYKWSNLYHTQTLINQSPGSYTVTVTDLNGCSVVETCDLVAPEIIAENLVITPATCDESEDGSIAFDITGGASETGLYEVNINNFVLIDEITNTVNEAVDTGLYIIEIQDDSMCVLEFEVYVDASFSRISTENYEQTELLCFGDSTACVTIDLDQPGPYVFSNFVSISGDGFPFPITSQDLDEGLVEVCDLPAGTYNWSAFIVGAPECAFDTIITINQPDSLVLTGGNIDPNTSCTDPNGVVLVDANGGTGSYTYDWDPDVSNTDIFDMADAGLYSITVTDENLCTDTTSVLVIGATSFDIDIQRDSAIGCNGSTLGGLTVLIDAMINDLSITWTQEEDASFMENGASITGLGEGTYYVEVLDNESGCVALDTAILAEVVDVVLDVTAQSNPSCANSTDGIIELSAMGGDAPYMAMWADFPGNTSLRIDTAGCGLFAVTIMDNMGCTADTILELSCPPALSIDTSMVTGITCYEDQTGSVTATASGGTPTNNGEYNYRWCVQTCNQNSFVSSTCNGIGNQDCWVVAEDINGCLSDTLFFTVPAPDSIEFDLSSVFMDPPCKGECDGVADLTIIGGTSPTGIYTAQWDDNVDALLRTDLCAGDYTVTVTDEVGCSNELSFSLSEPLMPFIVEIDSAFTTDIKCPGSIIPDGRIIIRTQGGTGNPGNFTYDWFPNVSDGPIADSLTANLYTITVTDEGGCAQEVSYEVIEPDEIDFEIAPVVPIQCAGESTCVQLENVTGGTGNRFRFQLNNQPPLISVDSCIEVRASEYLLSLFDSLGCFTDTIITITEPDPVLVDLGGDITVNLGDDEFILTPDVDALLPIINYTWAPIDETECVDASCSEVFINPIADGNFSLTVTDENGCTGDDEIFVAVREVRDVFMPNIFSPLGSQENRKVMVQVGPSAEIINFYKVYDRWGNEVYSVTDIDPSMTDDLGWDGSINGNQLVVGVYVSIASIRFKDGKDYIFTQDVTLIR